MGVSKELREQIAELSDCDNRSRESVLTKIVEEREAIQKAAEVILSVTVDQDALFQTTARTKCISTVRLSRNLPNFLDAYGRDGRPKVDTLLGNHATKIFHRNGDPTTNEWASKVIAKETAYKHSLYSKPRRSSAWESDEAEVVRFWTDDGDSWGFLFHYLTAAHYRPGTTACSLRGRWAPWLSQVRKYSSSTRISAITVQRHSKPMGKTSSPWRWCQMRKLKRPERRILDFEKTLIQQTHATEFRSPFRSFPLSYC